MKALFLAAVPLIAVASVHAASLPTETYFGLNLATPGEASFDINGRSVSNNNHPRPVKLYAGVQLAPRWAAELGYGAFGSWKAVDPTPGSAYQVKRSSEIVYAAARGTLPLGDTFALFSKVGLAVNRVSMHDSTGNSSRETFVRPMGGIGLEWKLTPQVSTTVEYAHYGSRGSGGNRFTQQKAEAGLVFKF